MSDTRETELTEAMYGISLKKRVTGSAAVAITSTIGKRFLLKEVRIHLSAAGGAGNLTIGIDSGVNAVYDTTLLTVDMTSIVDYVYQPNRPIEFDILDEVKIAWTNAGGKTYGVEILYSII